MKTIELTEEHKSKLLEMCNKLFPEYTIIQFGNQSNYYLEREEILDFYNEIEAFSIHWFEFCMTHLMDKLFEDSFDASDDIKNLFYCYYYNDIHPIDYLYEEFKQLK